MTDDEDKRMEQIVMDSRGVSEFHLFLGAAYYLLSSGVFFSWYVGMIDWSWPTTLFVPAAVVGGLFLFVECFRISISSNLFEA